MKLVATLHINKLRVAFLFFVNEEEESVTGFCLESPII